MSAPFHALIAYAPLADAVDQQAFAARFPGVELRVVAYSIPHQELVDRTERPDQISRHEVLPDDVAAGFAEADAAVALNLPLNLRAVAPRLKWVQAVGSGIGQFMASGIDGVVCTNAAGVSAPGIAEWVVAQIFSIYKRLPEHHELQRHRQWKFTPGAEIAGKRAAIVGLGAIGEEIAWRLGGLGLHVTGVRRRPPETLPRGVAEVATPDRLLEVAASHDILICVVPGSSANNDMFDAEVFAAMPAGSVFVNVGRGSSVDEAALIAALQSGHLRGAAIDVAKREPIPADDPLYQAPNLSISPHSAASQDHYNERLWALFCDNLEAFRAGRPLRNVVDMQAEYGH
jgi:phosphoglycerate dehydrogenase-like enzyme